MDEINNNKINAGPQINISVETIESVYHSYSQWRTAKTYLPLTPAEKAEYYKGYDPIIGVKIAGTLSVLFALAVLYVFYKSKCKRTKYPSTPICLDDPLFMEHQMLSSSCSLHQHQQPGTAVFASWDANSGILPASGTAASDEALSPGGLLGIKRQNSCESGRETPVSVISSVHHHHHQPHYYTDDREMPEWKKYAKELFLYGGPGLWRSASLKGSDPVLLMAQSSFDSESLNARSQLRSGSLSGSMMANLGIHHRRDSSRKHSVAMSTNSPTQSRLQVPNMGSGCSRPNRRRYTEFHPDDKFIILPPSGRNANNRNQQQTSANHRQHNNKDDGSDKPLPSRSVSFRESDMTNYQHGRTGSRRSRTRPGSLKTPRTDYNRLISDHSIDNNGQCGNSHRRASFRLPSRQSSIRNSRNLVSNNDATDQIMDPDCAIPSSDPNSRTVIVHRIPLHMQVDRHGNKGLYSRSTSLTTEPARGWRSTIAKLIRAKSTSGNAVGGHNGSESSGVGSPSRHSKAMSKLASLEGHHINKPSVDSSGGPNSPASIIDDHFDICVIQATPTASPCASTRSTLSGDSIEMSCLGVNKNQSSFPSINLPKMSVRERRKCFANMKGQTIVDQDAALLAPPVMDYGLLMLPGADHSGSPRCRSASPSMMNSYGNRSPSPGEASSWLQVLQHQQQKESAENHNNLSSNSSLSNHSSSHI